MSMIIGMLVVSTVCTGGLTFGFWLTEHEIYCELMKRKTPYFIFCMCYFMVGYFIAFTYIHPVNF